MEEPGDEVVLRPRLPSRRSAPFGAVIGSGVTERPGVVGDPGHYGAWFEAPLGRRVWEDERAALRELVGHSRGRRILDAGSGDGRLAVELAAEAERVAGVDASEAMLRAARTRAASARVPLSLAAGRLEALPFRSDAFDRVVAVTVLCWVDDPAAAMREIVRVTRPGGTVLIGELGRWSLWALERRARGVATGGASGGATGGAWSGARFWSRRELEALLENAGLRVLRTGAAVFYPPLAALARLMAPVDRILGRRTTVGAAFLALAAEKTTA